MKHLANGPILNYQGRPLKAPERDNDGVFIYEGEGDERRVTTHEADVADILDLLITGIPTQIMTRQDSIHITRLWGQIHKDGAEESEVLDLEDGEWDWVLKKLGDDKVGAKVFGANIHTIEQQLREYEREAFEPAKEKPAKK